MLKLPIRSQNPFYNAVMLEVLQLHWNIRHEQLQTTALNGTTSSRMVQNHRHKIISYTNPHNNHELKVIQTIKALKCNIVTIGAVTTQPENQQNLHDKLPLILQSSLTALTTSFSFCTPFYPSLTNTTKTEREREQERERLMLSCSPKHSEWASTHSSSPSHRFELWMLHTQVGRCRA